MNHGGPAEVQRGFPRLLSSAPDQREIGAESGADQADLAVSSEPDGEYAALHGQAADAQRHTGRS